MSEFFGLARTHRVVLSFEERSSLALRWLAGNVPDNLYAFFAHCDGQPVTSEFREFFSPMLPFGAAWIGECHLTLRDAVAFVTDHEGDLSPYFSVWVTNKIDTFPSFDFPYFLSGRWPWKEGVSHDSGGALEYTSEGDIGRARQEATDLLAWMVENNVIGGVVDGYIALGVTIIPV